MADTALVAGRRAKTAILVRAESPFARNAV
jgi:hypothetical protein